MNTHDEPRYQAFLNLSVANDQADFLARLKAAYARLGIGSELDVAPLEAAWLQGTALPLDWRVALARQTPFDRNAYCGNDVHEAIKRLHGLMYSGEPSAGWIARGEQLALLLAPLLALNSLVGVFMPRDYWVNPDRYAASNTTLGTGLRAWAEQLAQGEAGWGAVTEWLRSAGTEPGLLAGALASEKVEIQANLVDDLGGLRLLLLLVREQLLLGKQADEHWIDLLLSNLDGLTDGAAVKELDVPLGVLHQYSLPLLKVLLDSSRLAQLFRDADRFGFNVVGRLLGDLALTALYADTPERFGKTLKAMPDLVLRWTELSDSFVQHFPAAALLLEQARHQRGLSFTPRGISPEAQVWYLSIIGKLHGDQFSDVLDLIQRASTEQQLHEVITQHVKPRNDQHFSGELLRHFNNVEWLYSYLNAINFTLSERAAARIFALATVRQVGEDEDDQHLGAYAKHPENWAVLLRGSEEYPWLFMPTGASEVYSDDLTRWQLLWDCSGDHGKAQVAEACLVALPVPCVRAELLVLIERLYTQAPQAFHQFIADAYGPYLTAQISALAQQDTPLLRLVPRMAARYLSQNSWLGGDYRDPSAISEMVAGALTRHPQAYAELDEKARVRLLQLFDDSSLVACGDGLAQLFASSSKTLRDPAVAMIARRSATAIAASGLLGAAPKARKLVLIGIALSPQPAMLELVSRYVNDAAHDDYSRGLSLDALERGGYSLNGLDPWADSDLATLQAQAVGLKIPAAVSKCWNDEFASVLAPLGDALGLQLLHILSEGSEQLPRRARQLLQHLPAGRRSDFALLGTQQWTALNGAVEVDWLLLTLPVYGDERIANDLAKAIKDWKKIRKQKASAAMRLLCRLPGNYGVSLARDLWESGKFSESIDNAAQQALTEAGERQGMSLDEFLEQLVPDFGLTHQGLALDVGPYSYTVRMRPDLSLVVLDEKGKASKSLPKAKAGEDADKRSLAENQYKALAKNLKPVFKQQAKRLTRLFQLGSAWPAATWQKLFVEHPLMAVIAQSVVWSVETESGQPLKRFRPAEGGELIDLNDEPYSLPADANVHATHPLELDEAERAAWIAHFADYKLASPIEQWTTSVVVPLPDILAADHLSFGKNQALNRGKFGSLVDKMGYIKGQAGDGAQVREHTWLLDGGELLVTLNHGDIDVYFDPDATVSLHDIQIHRRVAGGFARQRLSDLPPAFLNTLLLQAAVLSAQAL